LCWFGNRKSIQPIKTYALKSFGKYNPKYSVGMKSFGLVRMFRVRMTGD